MGRAEYAGVLHEVLVVLEAEIGPPPGWDHQLMARVLAAAVRDTTLSPKERAQRVAGLEVLVTQLEQEGRMLHFRQRDRAPKSTHMRVAPRRLRLDDSPPDEPA